jgi:decaprenyl-phosphate phosphoribosyltransferase
MFVKDALMIRDYLYLIRPYQYFKNLFIFAPLFFGLKITNVELLSKTCLAFVAFSLVTSAVYVFNDYHDVEEDKRHPTKKTRPLASGSISKEGSLLLMFILLVFGLGITSLINRQMLSITFVYLVLNIAYTLKLKRIAIVDVFIIATGFVIRLYVGSVVTNIELSMWIIIMTFLLALFLSLAKRRDDVIMSFENGTVARKVVNGYNLDFLNLSMTIMAAVIIVSYIMYTVFPHESMIHINKNKLYLSVVFVILGIMRYLQITFVFKKSGSPTYVLLKDRFTQMTIIGWVITLWVLLY